VINQPLNGKSVIVTGRRFNAEFWEPGGDAATQAKLTASPMGFDLKTE
jgi:hypothetical protein